jgi:hypothetical protein
MTAQAALLDAVHCSRSSQEFEEHDLDNWANE